MQDEELDKIVQEAANQHHPPYDDSAWDKMEQLLDKHLPQQKDRKRPAFLLLLLLLLCGGTLFFTLVYPGLNSNKQPDNTAIVKNDATKNNDQSTTNNANNINSEAPVVVKDNATGDNDNVALPPNNTGNNSGSNVVANNDGQITNGSKNNPPTASSVTKNNGEENLVSPASPIAINKKAKVKMRISNGSLANDEMQLNNASTKSRNKKQDVAKNKKKKPNSNDENNFEEELATVTTTPPSNKVNTNPVVTDNPSTATAKTTVAEETNKEKKKGVDSVATAKREEKKKADTLATAKTSPKKDQKEKKGFASNFGITVSAGTDLSYVDAGHLGKATFLYGGGLSYAINKRLLVRTGFYVSKKIYSASPTQYNGVIYPYLTKVDGDCKVYEIPLSVNYNFGAKRNHNWFGSVGMSSFLMKKEEYLYTYKVPGGSTYYYNQTVNNENKHLFSVLNLSAGYQYNASEKVSFMAEPFVKLPLAGVGAGKIKLNSAGILITATVRPFAKKK